MCSCSMGFLFFVSFLRATITKLLTFTSNSVCIMFEKEKPWVSLSSSSHLGRQSPLCRAGPSEVQPWIAGGIAGSHMSSSTPLLLAPNFLDFYLLALLTVSTKRQVFSIFPFCSPSTYHACWNIVDT